MANQWDLLNKRQPVVWGEGDAQHEKLYDVLDTCRTKTLYRKDSDVWGLRDYWATPDEYLMKGAGDCEDTAICMYYELARLGFKQVYFVVGLDGYGGHAVVQVKTDKGLYVMDNNSRSPIPADKYIGTLLTRTLIFGGKNDS